MQLSVMRDYDRVFGTRQIIVQGGPIEFFVRGADELSLDLNNSKFEIKLKITLKNGTHLGGGGSVGPLNGVLNALFISMKMEFGGVLVTDPNTKYSFRAIVANLINYNKLIADNRLLADAW